MKIFHTEKYEPNKVELLLPIKTNNNIPSNGAGKTRKRKSYKELCKVITEFCKSWKTRQEIAIALGYKQDYLRNNVLPRMVADGYLEKLDKKSATSPNQKYKATSKKTNI